MKLKELRGHYREEGANWVPKRQFRSPADIRRAGFSQGRWIRYKCDFCNYYHVADRSKKEEYDNNGS